jgi:hypothetical protein
MNRMKAVCFVALFCFALALLPASAADAKTHPNFSGRWRLNTFLSEDPIEKIRRAAIDMERAERIGERGARRLDPGGIAARDRMRGKSGSRNGPEEVDISLHGLNLGATILEITHEEPRFIIHYPDGTEATVVTDGSVENNEYGYGPREVRARWKKKDQLVVRSKSDSGSTTTQKYELVLDGKQLKLVTNVVNQRPAPSFNFIRYYDLMPPEETGDGE